VPAREGSRVRRRGLGRGEGDRAARADHDAHGRPGRAGPPDLALVQAYPYLRLFGTVQLGVEALIQARVAARVIAEKGSTPHLAGKAANLRFYVRNLLPGATALAKAIQASDDSCLDPALFTEA
jgi:hypothetical protein